MTIKDRSYDESVFNYTRITLYRFSFFGRPLLKQFTVCNVGVLWPNGWMDQDETWHGGRPQPRPYCARWGPISPLPQERAKPHSPLPQLLAHAYCGQRVAHLSNCWALVLKASVNSVDQILQCHVVDMKLQFVVEGGAVVQPVERWTCDE